MAEIEAQYYDLGVFCFRSEPVSAENQTERLWLKMSNDQTKGSGLFYFPELDGQPVKVFLPNLTYREFLSLDTNVGITKWIPNWTEGFDELVESARQCRLNRAMEAADQQ